ncbi:acyltransferase family protein [Microvirga antarctica]|uniref:acyltransferase family protein n=1 Tax=Microvirga antarctica TaxID=2819233 RepID=UPI001B30F1D2|nr:acyltransferase [Microvirga antarctica]
MRFSDLDRKVTTADVRPSRWESGVPSYDGDAARPPGFQASVLVAEKRAPIVALDIIRGVAALIVVLVHVRMSAFVDYTALPVSDRGLLTALFYGLTRSGNEAVLIFFVLSGLLVGGQIVTRLTTGRFDWVAYAVERTSRIFVPLIPAVMVTAVVSTYVIGHAPSILELLSNTLGLNGVVTETLTENRPLWSLAYEIWFYVIGGAIAYMIVRGPNLLSVGLLSAGAFIMAVLDTRYLLFFGLGTVATLFRVMPNRSVLFGAGFCLLATGGILNQLTVPTKFFANVPALKGVDGATLLCIGFCLMLPILCSERTSSNLLALRRPAAAMASFSYSLYLFHFPINSALALWLPQAESISLQSGAQFVLRVAICIIGSFAFYWCFERNTASVRRLLEGYFHVRPVP